MHVFSKPHRGYCASCDGVIVDAPVYRMDEAYCCIGCAHGGPCVCLYEQDVAADGVDHLGLPFPMADAAPEAAPERSEWEVRTR